MTIELQPVSTVLEREAEVFRARTPRSRALFARAQQILPGGNTRKSAFYEPYPAAIERASGIELLDIDGNHYRDFLLNYTTMILGHAHPAVVHAATEAMKSGSAIAAPTPGQVELAEELARRVASVERVRFVNSGTEATMLAMRIARTFTGRQWVIKISGGYHGSHPELDAAIRATARPPDVPATAPIRAVAFNDIPALRAAVAELSGDIAAVILEPVLGSWIIPASSEFLDEVRKLTSAAGALMILDEVITFRLSAGGYQTLVGIRPDLTCFGKIIGGGFPVGAVGGRADVMDVLAEGPGRRISHSGTFNGNPVTVAAGRETLSHLDESAYGRLDALGSRLAGELERAMTETRVRACVTHVGSLINVHFADPPISKPDDATPIDLAAAQAFHLGLMNRGIAIAPRGLFVLSVVTTTDDVDRAVAASAEIFHDLADAGVHR